MTNYFGEGIIIAVHIGTGYDYLITVFMTLFFPSS